LRILLTGGDGFTGVHFQALARARGHMVATMAADLTDADAVAREVASIDFDAVLHLAAISFVGHRDEAAFYRVNVIGTLNLLDAILDGGKAPNRVVLASSANVYGNCPESPIGESQAPAPVNHYAMSKLAMEHLARTRGERLPIVIARPFNYTGPGQATHFLIPKLVDHFARRAPRIELGNLDVEREFNDVDDVGEAYLALLAAGVPGSTYNVCSGRAYALSDVVSMLAEMTLHDLEVVINPAFVRSNEVKRLAGSPRRLMALFDEMGRRAPTHDFRRTLARMLDAAATRAA